MNIKIKFELEETELKGKIENLIPTTSGGSQDAVLYTAQSLTDEQKTQARSNIGAGTSDFSGSYNDLIGSPEIPKSLSELSGDSDHRTVSDAEKESWNKKSNFSGDYNDLNNKPIIQEPYVLPAATAQTLGGVKIGDGINIAEDGTISAEVKIPRMEKTASDVITEIIPNTFYVFPEMASLSVTLAAPSDTTVVNEYRFRFTSGATATTLTLPDSVIGELTVEANKVYEISVIDNYLVYQSWAVSA